MKCIFNTTIVFKVFKVFKYIILFFSDKDILESLEIEKKKLYKLLKDLKLSVDDLNSKLEIDASNDMFKFIEPDYDDNINKIIKNKNSNQHDVNNKIDEWLNIDEFEKFDETINVHQENNSLLKQILKFITDNLIMFVSIVVSIIFIILIILMIWCLYSRKKLPYNRKFHTKRTYFKEHSCFYSSRKEEKDISTSSFEYVHKNENAFENHIYTEITELTEIYHTKNDKLNVSKPKPIPKKRITSIISANQLPPTPIIPQIGLKRCLSESSIYNPVQRQQITTRAQIHTPNQIHIQQQQLNKNNVFRIQSIDTVYGYTFGPKLFKETSV